MVFVGTCVVVVQNRGGAAVVAVLANLMMIVQHLYGVLLCASMLAIEAHHFQRFANCELFSLLGSHEGGDSGPRGQDCVCRSRC